MGSRERFIHNQTDRTFMKVIQVGIGGMGNAWLRTVQDSDEVSYAGFVEVSDKIAAEQVEKWGIDSSTIYKSLPEA